MTEKKFATRRFRDAGTETIHQQGDEVTGDAKVLANYEAAGLIAPKRAEASADKAKPAAPAKDA